MSNKFTIDATQPGSVLQDFQRLLDFIGEAGLPVSKQQMVLAPNTLVEFNARMTTPVNQDKPRPSQKTFPHISVLYQCAKWLGCFCFTDEGARKRVMLNAPVIASWQQLNLVEQYFTLMKLWLFGDPNDYRSFLPPVTRLEWFQTHCLSRAKEYYPVMLATEYQMGELLAGLELFGLVAVKHAPPFAGGGWNIESIKLTPTGKFVLDTLAKNKESATRLMLSSRVDDDEESDADRVLQTIFRPYFSDLKNIFVAPQEKLDRPGTYVFKVSLGKVWRRIAIPHQATLDDLAASILNAFGFDNDHLYLFEFVTINGVKQRYAHPMADDDAFTDEITLSELPLAVKASMNFVFDFGDCWEFKVLLEKVDEVGELDEARVIASKGEAPEQYPDWPDGEW